MSIVGILAVVCGLLVLLLPETKGISLPETVEDVELLSRYDMCFLTVTWMRFPEGVLLQSCQLSYMIDVFHVSKQIS